MSQIVDTTITRLALEYAVAVCSEISARDHGDLAAWQQAVNDQANLREQIAWLKEKRDAEVADLAVRPLRASNAQP